MGFSQVKMESELHKKINEEGWYISRIPEWAKEVIKEVALAEHANDYGNAIAQFVREANEYRILKAKFFNNDLNVSISYPEQQKEEAKEESIKFANGKIIKKMEVQNE
jgi:hypothetical protein